MTRNPDIATLGFIENDRELYSVVKKKNDNECCAGIITAQIASVLDAVLMERQQLIENGCDVTHDSDDMPGSLARIATCYALCGARQQRQGFDRSDNPEDYERIESERQSVHGSVDYSIGPVKNLNVGYSPRENLARAAAFILAEIECIDCVDAAQALKQDDEKYDTGAVYARLPPSLKAVLMERQHQIENDNDVAHDDKDPPGNRAQAAAYYTFCAYWQRRKWNTNFEGLDEQECIEKERLSAIDCADFDVGYPWAHKSPSVKGSARENLVQSAALILAEIECIDCEKAVNE